MPCVQKSDGSFGLLYTYTALLQIGKKKKIIKRQGNKVI